MLIYYNFSQQGYILLFCIIWGIIESILFGTISCIVATNKGRSGGWFWLGFFLGLIGLVIVACLENFNVQKQIDDLKNNGDLKNQIRWVCLKCNNKFYVNKDVTSAFCPKCGTKLTIKKRTNDKPKNVSRDSN